MDGCVAVCMDVWVFSCAWGEEEGVSGWVGVWRSVLMCGYLVVCVGWRG